MKVTRLQVIVAEDGEVIIEPNQLGVYVDEKEIKDIVKKEVAKRVKDADVEDILDLTLDDMVRENIEEEMTKRLGEGSKLEEHITEVAKEETLDWIRNNIDCSTLEDILKEAMVERLREFSFEQVKELMNSIK